MKTARIARRVIRITELSELLLAHPDIEDVYLSWEFDPDGNGYWALIVTTFRELGGRQGNQVIDLDTLCPMVGEGTGTVLQFVLDEFKAARVAVLDEEQP